METIKFYQRKCKHIKEEKELINVDLNRVPETLVKPVLAKPLYAYAKRKVTGNVGSSLWARICKEEAERDNDMSIMTSRDEKEEKEHISESSDFSCLILSLDLNKSTSDWEDAAFAVRVSNLTEISEPILPGNSTSVNEPTGGLIDKSVPLQDPSHSLDDLSEVPENILNGICTSINESNGGLLDRDVPLHDPSHSLDVCVSNLTEVSVNILPAICTSIKESYGGLIDRGVLLDDPSHSLRVPNLTELSENILPGISTSINESNEGLIDRDVPQDIPPHSLELSIHPNIAPPSEGATNNTECDQEKGLQLEDVHPVIRFEPKTPSIKHNKRPRDGLDTNSRPKKKRHRPKVVVDYVRRRPIKNYPLKEETRCIKKKGRKKPVRKPVRKNLSVIMLPTTLDLAPIHSPYNNLTATADLSSETKFPTKSDMGHGCDAYNVNLGFRELNFPMSYKKTRTERKRRRRLYMILDFFGIKGYIKQKRSNVRRSQMSSLGKCSHIPNNNYMSLHQISDESTGIRENSNDPDVIIKNQEERWIRTGGIDEKVLHLNPLSTKAKHVSRTSGGACEQASLSPKNGAVIPYDSSLSLKEGAIVPHLGSSSSQSNAIVLHHGPISTKKIKPIIDIDPMTMRRWIQIKRIEDGLGEEKEEVDEETKKRWEEDSKIFKGRIELFNKRMHEVLGNRKFKPWNGSVVDSVVGVFLTQNVSDFLSSSAYMSLAAKFPNETSRQEEPHCSQDSTKSSESLNVEGETLGDIEDFGKSIFARGMDTIDPLSTPQAGIPKSYDSVDMQHKASSEEATPRKRFIGKKKVEKKDWDSIRRKYSRPRNSNHTDSVDWKAVKEADVNLIAEVIKARGQHTILAERIKGFLDRVVELHGSIDLEWLRYAPPLIVKEYLLDIQGLGLKSVECIRLLELRHVAFPVDVNVARILVRLGWVPLKPLPGNLQFHLLEEYPIMDSVQKYLWPRLCEFDSQTLYEFHYQLITFGKIFCKKRSPNCNACPMKAECRHFASAVAASANLQLPGPSNDNSERSIVPRISAVKSQFFSDNVVSEVTSNPSISDLGFQSLSNDVGKVNSNLSITLLEHGVTSDLGIKYSDCVPLIEEPKSPEQVQNIKESDRSEDICRGSDADDYESIDTRKEEIPPMEHNNENGDSSRALIPLSVHINSVSMHKLKRTNRLRTEHQVYEIPDGHEILTGIEKRDPEDSVPYLLAIWAAGETSNSVEQPKKKCNSQGSELCNDRTCFACQSICEGNADIVRGTILIPCRTAMRARFPLNGTYFQVNEVFADHETSYEPLLVRRNLIWKLNRPVVFFGTSPSSIFTKNSTLTDIQKNFWTGFICLRGFDRKTRAPQPLAQRFHCSPSKMVKAPRKSNPSNLKIRFKGPTKKKGNDVNNSEEEKGYNVNSGEKRELL